MTYNVVHETLVGTSAGVRTWTTYESKEAYETWEAGEMSSDGDCAGMKVRDVYNFVAGGMSDKEAIAMCSTEKNTNAIMLANLRKLSR